MNMKKRILFVSDSIKSKSGYGTVARNLIKELVKTDKYEIAQLGLADKPELVDLPIFYYTQIKDHSQCCGKGPVIEYTEKNNPQIKYLNYTPVLKMHDNQKLCLKAGMHAMDMYSFTSVFFVIQHFKPDIVVPINDLWGLYNIAYLANRQCFKFIPYLAIDSDCMFASVDNPSNTPGLPEIKTLDILSSTDKTIVFTDWAKDVVNKTINILTNGKILNNIDVIPHGVDTSVWRPLTSKEELRKKYFDINNNVFLIGSVARNQPRKRLDAIFKTMRKFIDKKYENPNNKIMCYFHCALKDKMAWDLLWLATYYGLQDRCIFDNRLEPGKGPSYETLNEIVNCFDVHLSLTNSEGWHLPALETAAAGVPNIISKYSAHADWGKNSFLFVKIAETYHEPVTNFIKAVVDTDHAALQLKLMYDSKEMRKDYSKKGINLAKKLEWSNVAKQWENMFDSIDINNLLPNRYENIVITPDPKENDLAIKYLPFDESAPKDEKNLPSS